MVEERKKKREREKKHVRVGRKKDAGAAFRKDQKPKQRKYRVGSSGSVMEINWLSVRLSNLRAPRLAHFSTHSTRGSAAGFTLRTVAKPPVTPETNGIIKPLLTLIKASPASRFRK